MAFQLNAGLEVSIDGTTWYKLSDHNRQPIKITFEVIEKTNRMADGQLRRYVVARKHKITTSWQMFPSSTSRTITRDGTTTTIYDTVDKNKGGAWMQSFYESNVFIPVYVRITAAKTTNPAQGSAPDENTYKSSFESTVTYQTYITNFDYEIVRRNVAFDLTNISIEFTEI